MVSSLAPHKETITTFGIGTNVYNKYSRAKLSINIVMGMPAYHNLVCKFLSSLVILDIKTFMGMAMHDGNLQTKILTFVGREKSRGVSWFPGLWFDRICYARVATGFMEEAYWVR